MSDDTWQGLGDATWQGLGDATWHPKRVILGIEGMAHN